MENNTFSTNSELTDKKLAEAKLLVKLFGLDYDGTVADNEHKLPEVMVLVEKVLTANKTAAFITARAATALKTIVPPLQELLKKNNIDFSNFVAGANGTTLYEVSKDSFKEIYNHGLKLAEIQRAVAAGRTVYQKLNINRPDLAVKGLETFQKFLADVWDSFIPAEIVDICRPFDGELFTEEAKVTFVLPQDKTIHQQLIEALNRELGNGLKAVAGDETYVHITKQLEEDGKRVAIKTILKIMNLNEDQVVTFGDMPADNDAGLLSFPYSFTNAQDFTNVQKNPNEPPFVLVAGDLSPVAKVHQAIEYLIS